MKLPCWNPSEGFPLCLEPTRNVFSHQLRPLCALGLEPSAVSLPTTLSLTQFLPHGLISLLNISPLTLYSAIFQTQSKVESEHAYTWHLNSTVNIFLY